MTREQWLAGLEWVEGPPPPAEGQKYPSLDVGMVLLTADGCWFLVGDINDSGGMCGCCDNSPEWQEVVRWARLFEARP